MKHTPSPWEVALDSRSRAVIVTHQGKSIATVRGENAENNAVLIATAPKLIEALQYCLARLHRHLSTEAERDEIRNLIRKAKGESS